MESLIQLILCEEANLGDGDILAHNPFSVKLFPFMPTTVSFRVLAIIGLEKIIAGDMVDVSLKMYKKDDRDKLVFDSGVRNIGPLERQELDDRRKNLNINFGFNNIAVEEEGEYIIELKVGDNIKEQNFYIGKKEDVK